MWVYGIPIINHPFGNGLYKLSVVIRGTVYWYTHITSLQILRRKKGRRERSLILLSDYIREYKGYGYDTMRRKGN